MSSLGFCKSAIRESVLESGKNIPSYQAVSCPTILGWFTNVVFAVQSPPLHQPAPGIAHCDLRFLISAPLPSKTDPILYLRERRHSKQLIGRRADIRRRCARLSEHRLWNPSSGFHVLDCSIELGSWNNSIDIQQSQLRKPSMARRASCHSRH